MQAEVFWSRGQSTHKLVYVFSSDQDSDTFQLQHSLVHYWETLPVLLNTESLHSEIVSSREPLKFMDLNY